MLCKCADLFWLKHRYFVIFKSLYPTEFVTYTKIDRLCQQIL
jgi:hypothetical protein